MAVGASRSIRGWRAVGAENHDFSRDRRMAKAHGTLALRASLIALVSTYCAFLRLFAKGGDKKSIEPGRKEIDRGSTINEREQANCNEAVVDEMSVDGRSEADAASKLITFAREGPKKIKIPTT